MQKHAHWLESQLHLHYISRDLSNGSLGYKRQSHTRIISSLPVDTSKAKSPACPLHRNLLCQIMRFILCLSRASKLYYLVLKFKSRFNAIKKERREKKMSIQLCGMTKSYKGTFNELEIFTPTLTFKKRILIFFCSKRVSTGSNFSFKWIF